MRSFSSAVALVFALATLSSGCLVDDAFDPATDPAGDPAGDEPVAEATSALCVTPYPADLTITLPDPGSAFGQATQFDKVVVGVNGVSGELVRLGVERTSAPAQSGPDACAQQAAILRVYAARPSFGGTPCWEQLADLDVHGIWFPTSGRCVTAAGANLNLAGTSYSVLRVAGWATREGGVNAPAEISVSQ